MAPGISLDDLLAGWGFEMVGEFKPCVRYYEAMDYLLLLEEDVAYVAEYKTQFLTLLWHPHEKRLVGVKIENYSFLKNALTEGENAGSK